MKYRGYEDTDLIPELPDWKKLNGDSFTVSDWLGFHQSPELFIGFADVLWADFEERFGAVFLNYDYEKDDKAFNEELKRNVEQHYDGDWLHYQMIQNHCHIFDFIATADNAKSINAKQVEFIGNLLVEIWSIKLQRDFPHLKTKVEFSGIENMELHDAYVTFWAEKTV